MSKVYERRVETGAYSQEYKEHEVKGIHTTAAWVRHREANGYTVRQVEDMFALSLNGGRETFYIITVVCDDEPVFSMSKWSPSKWTA